MRVRWAFALLLCPALGGVPAPPARASEAAGPAEAAIRFYQRHLSSLRYGHCYFDPSCSEYAARAIDEYGLAAGAALAADRLVRCNVSARGHYVAGAGGRRLDPVAGDTIAPEPFVPRWLQVPDESVAPPVPANLEPGRIARLEEAAAFAVRLAGRGDCERAATEYQRAGSLAASPEADAWAFARIGQCAWAASDWDAAERAFLSAGALAATPGPRARAAYRAALCRFASGRFAACERLLEAPQLTPDSLAGPADPAGITADRPVALGGLCALALGDWERAGVAFRNAAALAPDPGSRARLEALQPLAARGARLPHRSPALAGALSTVLPGAGQVYCGRVTDGIRHLLVDAALAWTVVSFARDDRVPAAVLGASFALPFYAGNVMGARRAARDFDREQRLLLLRRALRESAR